MKRFDDTDWSVRHQLAASLGALPAGQRETAVLAFLEQAADRLGHDGRRPERAPRRGRHACSIGCSRAPGTRRLNVQRCSRCSPPWSCEARRMRRFRTLFARIADASRPSWQRAAALRGAEVAVIGGQLPGPPPRRGRGPAAGVEPPCPTCQGARGGPGGAYAFPGRPRGSAAGAGRGRRRPVTAVESRTGRARRGRRGRR